MLVFFSRFLYGGLRIADGFLSDLGEEVYESLTDFYGVKESRLTDCLQILIGFGRGSLRISYGFFSGLRRAGLQMAYGFLLDLGVEVYGSLTDFLRG